VVALHNKCRAIKSYYQQIGAPYNNIIPFNSSYQWQLNLQLLVVFAQKLCGVFTDNKVNAGLNDPVIAPPNSDSVDPAKTKLVNVPVNYR
jgi:hypothetical protein